jgi:tRNA-Thr(GGU) m(6)t(6)A37 methyltransferase TsaA
MEPIAHVENDVPAPIHEGWEHVVSRLVVVPELELALDQIEHFSHLIVLFWIDRVSRAERSLFKIHPRDRMDLPLVGVLATHTQYRPNPIGITVVTLIERQANVLVVRGLDAIDGTPVLDLKPFVPARELVTDVRVPEWQEKLV